MPLIIMGLTSRNSRRQGQNRFGPIQRLDLALFIHAQDNGPVRWIEIKGYDISHLLHELWVFGEFEILHTMRLQSERMPDPNDSILRETCLRSHQPSAPVRAVRGHRFQRLGYDLFNLLVRNLPRCADPWLIQQAVQTELPKSFPPLADRCTRNMQLLGDFCVAHPLPTGKYDAGTHRHGLS